VDERTSSAASTADRELVVVRVFEAPRELLWKMWTDPKHLPHWWGLKGSTNTVHEMDLRPDGVLRLAMQTPDGRKNEIRIVYQELVKPERIVYLHDSPPKCQVTATFIDVGGKTELTMHLVFESTSLRDQFSKGATFGTTQALDRLGQHIRLVNATTHKAESDVFFKRVFDAPRELVFKVWTEREHLSKWWGPKGFTNPLCEIDLRPGGAMRIDMRGPQGTVYPMSGQFLEIVPPERLVFVSSALDEADKPLFEVMNIVTFEEHDGKTMLTLHASVFKMTGGLAAQYISGMEMGWTQSLERLRECIAEVAVAKVQR
jgi:uncharacterized protein YndB with AHSA1/START domain